MDLQKAQFNDLKAQNSPIKKKNSSNLDLKSASKKISKKSSANLKSEQTLERRSSSRIQESQMKKELSLNTMFATGLNMEPNFKKKLSSPKLAEEKSPLKR